MRTILALLVGTAMFAAPAFAECCCCCGHYSTTTTTRRVSNNGYYMQNGKVMLFRDGGITELTQEATLEDGSRVMMDGTVILRDGTRRTLSNNQWIFVDGRFSDNGIRTDSQINLSMDGYFRENGKTFVMRNGQRSEVTAEITLDNGSRLLADGTMILKDGTRTELRDGHRLAFDGSMRQQDRPIEQPAQNVTTDRFNENKADQNLKQPDQPSINQNNPALNNTDLDKTENRDANPSAQPVQPATPPVDSNKSAEKPANTNQPTQGRGEIKSSDTPASNNQPTQGRGETKPSDAPANNSQPTQGRGETNK